jgi:hypothetical protein
MRTQSCQFKKLFRLHEYIVNLQIWSRFPEFSVDSLDIVITEQLWDRNYRCEAFNGSGNKVDVTKTTLPAVVTSGRWTSQGK